MSAAVVERAVEGRAPKFDKKRMSKAMASHVTDAPERMTREEKRAFILSRAR